MLSYLKDLCCCCCCFDGTFLGCCSLPQAARLAAALPGCCSLKVCTAGAQAGCCSLSRGPLNASRSLAAAPSKCAPRLAAAHSHAQGSVMLCQPRVTHLAARLDGGHLPHGRHHDGEGPEQQQRSPRSRLRSGAASLCRRSGACSRRWLTNPSWCTRQLARR